MSHAAGKLTITDGTRKIVIDPSTLTITTSAQRLNIGAVGNAHVLNVSDAGPGPCPAVGKLSGCPATTELAALRACHSAGHCTLPTAGRPCSAVHQRLRLTCCGCPAPNFLAPQVQNLKATGAVNLGPTTVAGTTSIAKATYANGAIKAAGVKGELRFEAAGQLGARVLFACWSRRWQLQSWLANRRLGVALPLRCLTSQAHPLPPGRSRQDHHLPQEHLRWQARQRLSDAPAGPAQHEQWVD